MPKRKIPIITGQVYHIFNRGINKQPIFFTPRNYKRAVNVIKYYLIYKPPLPYSKFQKLPFSIKDELLKTMSQKERGVEVISYVLMSNHYHFLLRQTMDKGINNFIRKFQISYTKYINKRLDRSGALIQGQYKAVLIEDDEQLIHVNRYIHLNPYTSYIVKNIEELKGYAWSSLPQFLGEERDSFCQKGIVLSLFKNVDKYWGFLANQADYQRNLDRIKHLMID